MQTPILFLVFNRPDCTTRVLAEIRRTRPARLFVVADGPRADRPGDAEKCAAVRKIVDDGIDWQCEVHRDYASSNMGCARRVASGISWFFEQVTEGIVLEDDCLPAPAFFPYCEELLARYRNDTRVGQICGTSFIAEQVPRPASYLFSRYGPVWGWASWRRAWASYDLEMKNWPAAKAVDALASIALSKEEHAKRTQLYERLHSGDLHTWDYQWGYAKMSQSMLSIIPTANLIENTGFGPDGTHTLSKDSKPLRRQEMPFPLRHPQFVLVDQSYDREFSRIFAPEPPPPRPSWVKRLFGRLS